MIYLYYFGICLLLLYTGYRMWKEFKDSSNGQLRLFGFIIWFWFAMVLFYQFPNLRKSDFELKEKYRDTTYISRDKMQEDPELYLISQVIRSNIQTPPDISILILFSGDKADTLDWLSSSYWQYRLRYRNYPQKMDFSFVGNDGKYHDYYNLLLKNRPGFESQNHSDKILSPETIQHYENVLYIGTKPKVIPAGFEIVSTDTVFTLLKKKESP